MCACVRVFGDGDGMSQQQRQEQYRLWDCAQARKREDNHTDENFLRDLVVNGNVTRRNYWQVVWESQCLVQQICIASVVPATFLHLKSQRLGVGSLVVLNAGILVTATFTLLAFSWKTRSLSKLVRFGRQCILLLTGVYNLSPLYQKLTISVSSDTIGASSVLLLTLHLFLYDYSFKKSITESISGSISLGAAIATSVLLSSRLDTPYQVFSYLSFGLGLFVLSPFLRKDLQTVYPKAYLVNTLFMLGITFIAIDMLSKLLSCAFGALVIFTAFVCPKLLVSVEKHKVQINGPWDEAQLQETGK